MHSLLIDPLTKHMTALVFFLTVGSVHVESL